MRAEPHKCEVPLIASTLFVVKAKKIHRNTTEMHNTVETELSHETAFTNSAPNHKYVNCLHHKSHIAISE